LVEDFVIVLVLVRETEVAQVRYTTEQIIHKLREIEVVIAQGASVKQACRQCGIADKTYYKWRKEYGGLRMDQAKRFKDLEKENARLKKLLAEAELDKAILKEAASGNF
jgi:putative transposase